MKYKLGKSLGYSLNRMNRMNRMNPVMPEPDLFNFNSRTGLEITNTLGLSASIQGGRVADMTAVGSRLYKNQMYSGKPYFKSKVEFSTNPAVANRMLCENGYNHINDVHSFTQRGGTRQMMFTLFNSAGTRFDLFSTNTYLDGSKIVIETYYDGSKMYMNIWDWSGNELESKTLDIGAQTLRSGTNQQLMFGYMPRFAGSYGSIQTDIIYKNDGVTVIDLKGNNAINSVDGVALNNVNVTFPLLNNSTPDYIEEALDEGYYIDEDGNQIVNPQYAATTETVIEGGKVHNGIDSYINLNPTESALSKYDSLDRTEQTAASQASIYYDEAEPFIYFAGHGEDNELKYDTIQTYLQAEDTNTVFAAIKDSYSIEKYLNRLMIYAASQTGDALTKIKNYIGWS